ncbi:MAG: hypothetical protein ACJAWG_002181 [Candidatus Azotimanducaceae bacterium]
MTRKCAITKHSFALAAWKTRNISGKSSREHVAQQRVPKSLRGTNKQNKDNALQQQILFERRHRYRADDSLQVVNFARYCCPILNPIS